MLNLKINPSKLFITLIYLIFLTIFHWGLKPDFSILLFLGGGIFGVYFLDLAEQFFKSSPSLTTSGSPFRNVLFQVVLVILTLFVLTSSGSLFGAGLVLSIALGMLLEERLEWRSQGNLNSWFWIVRRDFPLQTQQFYFLAMAGIFIFLSLLFV